MGQAQSPSAARVAMANRRYVTFGEAYIRDLLAGTQRDVEKQISHGVALGLGTASHLRRMSPKKLIALLAENVSKTTVQRAPCVHAKHTLH